MKCGEPKPNSRRIGLKALRVCMGREARHPLRRITCDLLLTNTRLERLMRQSPEQPDWRCPSARRRLSMFQRQNESHFTSAESANGHVHEVVRQAHEELRQLMQQRAEVVKRIGTVKQTIAGLANLFGDSVLSDELLELVDRKNHGRQPGFTKACRMILMETNRALSARDMCEQIQQKLPPMLARHKDPMASVTTVLNRLVEYGEARALILESGRRAWQWVAEPDPQSSSSDARTKMQPHA